MTGTSQSVSNLVVAWSESNKHGDSLNIRKFPDGFIFGTSTAAYQVEGAWNKDGKAENIWDRLTHGDPSLITDCSNGDIAADSYHLYKRDVEMMRELGLDYYRFSLSWSRILPTSFPDKINEAGVAYYNNLIDEMLKYNIEPMVTLYHWDLPQKLQEMGGWTNPHIVEWYADYARVAFERFGDRVKYWITMNEPREVCYQGYGGVSMAPRLNIQGIADYMCTKNLLMAHATAYHLYDKEFRPKQGGSIFITLSAHWYEPATENDVLAAEETNQVESQAQGFPRSRLPEFTPEEVEYVKGTSDFFGLNHYSTYLAYRNESVEGVHDSPSYYDDIDVIIYQSSEWEHGASSFLKVVPWGFYNLLSKIKEDFDNPPVIITENGFSTHTTGLNDDKRISYFRRYLSAMLDAMEDGADVRAYTAWSIMDNFEWMERFGLYEVDYESPERTRTPRKSAFVYKEILRTRTLDFDYHPDTITSQAQGFPRSRLPEFTPEEVEYVKGTSDFFGLNHYSTYLAYRNESVEGVHDSPSYYDDIDVIIYQPSEWEHGASSFLKVVPWGFYNLLSKIKEDFDNPPVIITENGFSTHTTGLHDDKRISYFRGYLSAMLDAMEDGADVRAYTAWSIMDNFEWMSGYTERFGLYEVDYESPERTRTPRKSAFVYKEILRTRTLDFDYHPDTITVRNPKKFIKFTFISVEKAENIWDHMTHTNPCLITDCSNGDVADDSYHLYKRDVEMMRELGLDYYRFSLSWSRILPTSFPDKISEAGVAYYNNLIDEMLKYNIEPMVTLYHWDLPQKLQEMGGWTNPHIVDWYADYARVAFERFGDRVKYWITMNEPREVCYQGYGSTTKAPRMNIQGIAEYMCAKNLLMAHAKAYHIYDEEFRPTQGGSIFITLSAQWYEPETLKDIAATEETNQFEWGQYAHPIFSESGDFPPIMKEKIAAKSKAQGFLRSRLPVFTPDEVEYVKGTSDFFGLNHYTTYLAYRNESVFGIYDSPSYYDDRDVGVYQPPAWDHEDYNNPPVYITENGYSTYGGLVDDDRISYYRKYISAMLDAMEDGADIRTYTAWSIMDNFEWMEGYTERFGLYEVDYESPERTRTPRKSAFVYKEILRTRTLDFDFQADTTVMTIDEGH
ncbi:Uncharacterized protein OBRU01_19962 [Operophtera brumata]|uniref:beta-glucosidase n=1 Tax=Operophtera brumata TaxID=104452 RepID=A0A0L7KVS3_OPEBR|nr:Uncharacterized protein OBRU01_19962 [Operophtera brumata]